MSRKKTSLRHVTRRQFLGAAAGTAAAASAPLVWIPKRAFAAATPAFGTAEHVLVLFAAGGLRSQPLFNADVAFQHNPFGQPASVAPGTQWGVGKILGETPVDLFNLGEQLPPVSAISNEISVLAGVDHEPTQPGAQIDHFLGDMAVTGGYPDAETGMLARVHRDHPGYQNGSLALPPFDIGLSTFGRGEGDYAGYRPLAVQSASDFTGNSQNSTELNRARWAVELRNELDEPFIARRAPYVRPYMEAARDSKINSVAYTAALHSPALDLLGVPDAPLGGLTNTNLLEIFGYYDFPQSTWALETAFALRLFQFGVPMVTVLRYLFDSHSDEKTLLPVDGGDLGRQMAGLNFALKRLTDTQGNTLWDKTAVIVVSEFGRDNTIANTGFNSADGSDHQGSPACRNQCWPIFGGPIPGGKRIGGLDPATLATTNGPAFSVRCVWSTVFDLLGMDHLPYWQDAPIQELWL